MTTKREQEADESSGAPATVPLVEDQSPGFRAKLTAALSAAQAAFPVIPKSKEAKVTSKRTGSSYTYMYADLGDVIQAIQPSLTKNGLAITHGLRLGPFRLVSLLRHVSGEYEFSEYPLGDPSEYATHQELGAAITYGRRYNVSCLTNCVADEDTDAPGAPLGGDPPKNGRYQEPRRRDNGGDDVPDPEPPIPALDPALEETVLLLVGEPGHPPDRKVRETVLDWCLEPPASYHEARELVTQFVADLDASGTLKGSRPEDLVKEVLGHMRVQANEREANDAGL